MGYYFGWVEMSGGGGKIFWVIGGGCGVSGGKCG